MAVTYDTWVARLNREQAFTERQTFGAGVEVGDPDDAVNSFELTAQGHTGFAVPLLRPTAENSVIALDVSPNGTVTEADGFYAGRAWIDICSEDASSDAAAFHAARVAAMDEFVEFGAKGFNQPPTAVALTSLSGYPHYPQLKVLPDLGVEIQGPLAGEIVALKIKRGLATAAVLRLEDDTANDSAITRGMSGIELVGKAPSASAKYGPALKFMSADAHVTTERPRIGAAILGRVTESYSPDTDGGMVIDFAVTADDPGATSVPVVRASITAEGIAINNVPADPAIPRDGGVLYVKGGGLYFRGSGGTITQVAPP